ncbi:hypothetical protein K491DRAFT_698672 [Lophiostoma macrostomum CBS 122681]|uniref:Uncharacterized protein n=1 Tax=Lophiostoma macrostomum CBS 122681 TaxID=1314788 RepID=A0A6A6SQW0_9PLEO|nr:hypothetical protein K491DRAFT_698672 [Lophiostoma macrostomum CBS 122681]
MNEVLSRAEKENFGTGWNLWVASSEYSDIPRRPMGSRIPEGSKPPLESLPSVWIGKTIEQCAQWLSQAPEDIAVNRIYFAVISENMKENDTVTLCRTVEDIPEENEEDRGQLQYFSVETERTDLILMQMAGDRVPWEADAVPNATVQGGETR